ncbi:MAG: hypothetical protein ACXWV2_02690 [Chitinophagaceae bacterium]
MTGTSLPFNTVNDSLFVIPYEGGNVPSYDVIVQKVNVLYIIYSNRTEILPGKIDVSNYKYLLQQSDQYDIIKIGLTGGK